MKNINPIYLNEDVKIDINGINHALKSHKIMTRAGAYAGHKINNMIIVHKIMKAFPTPSKLKKYLISSSDINARAIGNSIDENMDNHQYKKFIYKYMTGKFGILNLLSGRLGLGIQSFKLGKNIFSSGRDMVDSAIDNNFVRIQ